MEISEVIAILQRIQEERGDIMVLDADEYAIEEISVHNDQFGDWVVKMFSEGDEH